MVGSSSHFITILLLFISSLSLSLSSRSVVCRAYFPWAISLGLLLCLRHAAAHSLCKASEYTLGSMVFMSFQLSGKPPLVQGHSVMKGYYADYCVVGKNILLKTHLCTSLSMKVKGHFLGMLYLITVQSVCTVGILMWVSHFQRRNLRELICQDDCFWQNSQRNILKAFPCPLLFDLSNPSHRLAKIPANPAPDSKSLGRPEFCKKGRTIVRFGRIVKKRSSRSFPFSVISLSLEQQRNGPKANGRINWVLAEPTGCQILRRLGPVQATIRSKGKGCVDNPQRGKLIWLVSCLTFAICIWNSCRLQTVKTVKTEKNPRV